MFGTGLVKFAYVWGRGQGGATFEVWKTSFHWLNGAQQDCQSLYSLRRSRDLGGLDSLRSGARTGMTRAWRSILPKTDKSEKQREKEKRHRGVGMRGVGVVGGRGQQHSNGFLPRLPSGCREVLASESLGIILGSSPHGGGNWGKFGEGVYKLHILHNHWFFFSNVM